MANGRENTVPGNATLQTDSENDWMQREAKYLVTMKIIKGWQEKGLISSKEYRMVKQKFKEKYCPKIGDLLLE